MLFVAIEHIDGAGGTGTARLLCDLLRDEGHNILQTAAPFKATPFEPAIRELLKAGFRPFSDALLPLLLADRKTHWEWINSFNHIDVVVTDRWHHSTLAYQSVLAECKADSTKVSERVNNSNIPFADITIHIDPQSTRTAMDRMNERLREKDWIETDAVVQDKVLQYYRSCPDIIQVDASNRPSIVARNCFNIVKERLC